MQNSNLSPNFWYPVFKKFIYFSNKTLGDYLYHRSMRLKGFLTTRKLRSFKKKIFIKVRKRFDLFVIKTAVLNDLQTVSAAFAEKPSVADFFTNPFVPQNEKLAALEAVAGETGMAQEKFKNYMIREIYSSFFWCYM